MDFQVFIEKKGNQLDSLEAMMLEVKSLVDDINIEVIDVGGTKKEKELAKEKGIEETPALLFEKVRISGAVNEYFILACVAQLITDTGSDQAGSEIELSDKDAHTKLKVASGFLTHQTQIREETDNFLMMIRSSTDEFNPKKIEEMADSGTTIYLLTNFEEGKNVDALATLGTHQNVLIGHILRTNIHMTMSITVRKGRPFFGSYLRAKNIGDEWTGKWSPLLHDTVSELKDFFVPLFQTSSPVTIDGQIPEPLEVNRLVAKVKDNIDILKALFF